MPRAKVKAVRNLVVISDLHVGCRLALCHPDGFQTDDGGMYRPSAFQRKVWAMWSFFWSDFVPEATRGEPFAVVCNGDAIDGSHHGSTTQISHNIEDQRRHAQKILAPVVEACKGRYYHVRGTEAHVGQASEDEEALARSLNAIPNALGQHARNDLWFMVGDSLGHILHHIGTTGSQAFESTAVHRELVEEFIEAARTGARPPDWIIRSHRHRYLRTEIPTARGHSIAATTPSWQGKTGYAWKIAGARLSAPQFGGVVVRQSADGEVFVRPKVWTAERSATEGA
jgi:hypothetical protein